MAVDEDEAGVCRRSAMFVATASPCSTVAVVIRIQEDLQFVRAL